MYKTGEEARDFITALIPLIKDTLTPVFLAVPFTALGDSVKAACGTKIIIGAQNMHDAEEGAFTGEISARMLKKAGAEFVLLGHSERRQIFFETDAFINRKIKRALQEDLKPILCVGETKEEREKGLTDNVLSRQLKNSLEGLHLDDWSKLTIAYEPVWAIGTGLTATPAVAQETHAFISTLLPKKIPILYGGSVKPENAAELLSQPDIQGALIGGASLNVDSFAKIIKINFRN